MSFMALNSALSGLRSAQAQLNVISSNVSNATTPGYSRKILPQSTQVINSTGETVGVRTDMMIRRVDLNLESQMWTQISIVSQSDVKAAYLDVIEKFHGAADKESSIAAHLAGLKDKFAALSDSPSDGFLMQSTVDQAKMVAGKFNDFAKLISELRNDAQNEMSQTVNRVNDLLKSVAELNSGIKGTTNVGRSSAALEDLRDEAIKELSTYLDVTFFTRGDGVLVLQTNQGVQLADERATEVFFNGDILGPTTTYPQNVGGVYVGGNPNVNLASIDVTSTGLGGKLGGLIDLRDNMLVRYQSQLDELAHKTALRFEAQGLRLFTDGAGGVPLDTAPDPVTGAPVSYVGFANIMQVNQAILDDVSLIQKGTYVSDRIIPAASNEVVRRVLQFTFGDIAYQNAAGTIDLNIGGGAADLQQWLGLPSANNVVGGINLAGFGTIDDPLTPDVDGMMLQMQEFFPNYPNNDVLRITFSDPDLGLGDMVIDLDLSDAAAAYPIAPPTVSNALDQITSYINGQIATAVAATPGFAGYNAVATRNSNGQLVIKTQGDVGLSASGFPDAMGTTGLGALGLKEGFYQAEDPYFDIQVGSSPLQRISIKPGETVNDLIAKLEYNPVTGTGVPGLNVSFDTATGRLTLRPGMTNAAGGPDFGGDIRIISGPHRTAGAANPALSVLPGGVSLAGALFGSFSVSGGQVLESSPVTNVKYGSEVSAGSGAFVPFRTFNLGPNANQQTNILTGTGILDFSQKMINSHAQDILLNQSAGRDASTLRDMLEERLLNESGVNIDEELSHLIVVQTAYAAAARAVTAASEMFDDLLNAFRR
jgi:flagellar hook-associated protein 1 FlgK